MSDLRTAALGAESNARIATDRGGTLALQTAANEWLRAAALWRQEALTSRGREARDMYLNAEQACRSGAVALDRLADSLLQEAAVVAKASL